MTSRRNMLTALFASLGILLLVLDSKTALTGAQEAIELCIRAVIPSLFPFFILSVLLTSSLSGVPLPVLRPLGKLCGIPRGAESLLLIGLLGGYPVGAQSIYHAYRDGTLCRQDALRMLGFCNNAGPAFLFGIVGTLFSRSYYTWILWGIHILSALLVGAILPQKSERQIAAKASKAASPRIALRKSLGIMAEVCGWIVLFRIMIAFLDRWFLWILPKTLSAAVRGVLELVNGLHFLHTIQPLGARFVLCSVFLAFGGICVTMQTVSVTKELGTGWYFPGKVLQSIISILLSLAVQGFLFSRTEQVSDVAIIGIIIAFLTVTTVPLGAKLKKTVAFWGDVVYNS